MHDLHFLTLQQLSTYDIMHEYVNEWHSIKARNFKRKP